MIKIEKGIQYPIKCRKYPYTEMEVWDSFLVTDRSPDAMGASASQMGRRLNRKFRTSKTKDGVRVWRVA